MVVPEPEFSQRIVQRLEASHFPLIQLLLQRPEQSLDPPVLPRTAQIGALLADARQREHNAKYPAGQCGRRFRTFSVTDDCNREILAIEIDLNLPAARVIRVLERIAAWRGYPAKLRMDNGPEFIAGSLADWAQQHGVALEFIQPGRPMQNGFIERLNRSYREAVLEMYLFKTLEEVRERTESWIVDYNETLPHDSLGDLTPVEYRVLHYPETSNNGWH